MQDPITPASKARVVPASAEDLFDIEDIDEADCERFDDLMVHFEGNSWRDTLDGE